MIDLASDMNRSTPKRMVTFSIGMSFMDTKVELRTINPLPVTPAAPFEVTIKIPIAVTCSATLSSILKTWVRKIRAIDR
ncbi:hypothetical protein D3C71_1707450 [compost metagenome]